MQQREDAELAVRKTVEEVEQAICFISRNCLGEHNRCEQMAEERNLELFVLHASLLERSVENLLGGGSRAVGGQEEVW